MAVVVTKLGPGTLKLAGGVAPTGIDASCQVRNAVVAWDKDTTDPFTVLCGDEVPGDTTYSATFSGTMVQDLSDDTGIVAFTWAHKGETIAFEYVPNTDAGVAVTGEVVVDPLSVGSTDDFGTTMTSDFEWNCVGEPALGTPTPLVTV